MSGGEPSSIKRKPSCAAELPILSPNRGKAVGRAISNCPCAVLWGAEQNIGDFRRPLYTKSGSGRNLISIPE